MNRTIYILADYRNHFYSSVRYSHASMDIPKIKKYFENLGYKVIVTSFCEINLREIYYKDSIILYQSTEDRNLEYHDYIEDILLGLKLAGAILIPDFHYFRAHHNKVFMELLRDLHTNDSIKNIRTRTFGTLEEYKKYGVDDDELIIIKPAQGAKSSGVQLVRDKSKRLKHVKNISRTFNLEDISKEFVKSIIRPYHVVRSHYRRKFLAQTFVPGLNNDFKIVIYGNNYYVLHRDVKKGDFRASGSGIFDWPELPPDGLLDYARSVFESFNVPFISIDVGYNGDEYYLFEFQFIHFGNTTLEKSGHYFTHIGNDWTMVKEKSDLEETFAESIDIYLKKIN